MIRRLFFVLILILMPITPVWGASVFFQPSGQSVVNGNPVSVDLLADLPNPALGWGLDVSFDSSILSLTNVAIGSSWAPSFAPDGDGLVGLAFPFPISGNNITLATLTFDTLGSGTSSLDASITPLDFTEGIPLLTGGFDTVIFTSGSVEVTSSDPTSPNPIPEPSTIVLFASGLAGLAAWRIKIKK